MRRQTVLPIGIEDDNTLDSFHTTQNQLLVGELKQLLDAEREKRVLYLWGESGSGKTHLLDACCAAAGRYGRANYYLSLKQNSSRLNSLMDVDKNALICIDDLEEILGSEHAQKQIFLLYESVMSAQGGIIIVSGNAPLASLGLELKDLESRLSSGGIYHVHALNDDEKYDALKLRAKKRGFPLDDNVVEFIMTHYRRDTKSLFGLLDKLDSASLQAHRKITIPFVKSLL